MRTVTMKGHGCARCHYWLQSMNQEHGRCQVRGIMSRYNERACDDYEQDERRTGRITLGDGEYFKTTPAKDAAWKGGRR